MKGRWKEGKKVGQNEGREKKIGREEDKGR